MKILYLEVSNCMKCPHCDFIEESIYPLWICSRENREILELTDIDGGRHTNKIDIPEWCGLENK